MLGLAAQMVRFRKGSFVATFVALAAGVMILMTCALLVESGLRYQGQPERYAGTVAVVAVRDLTVTGPAMFGEPGDKVTVALPERGSVPDSLVTAIGAVPGVAQAVGDRSIPLTAMAAPGTPIDGHGWASAALSPYKMISGTPPSTDGEIAVETGESTELIVGGVPHRYRVSGVVEAGGVFFTDAQAARLDPHPGRVDAIGVLAEPGADRTAVLAGVRRLAG